MKQRHARPAAARLSAIHSRKPLLLLAAAITLALGSLSFALSHARPASGASQQERFEGQWMIEQRAGEEKVQLTLRHSDRKDAGKNSDSYSGWNTSFGITPDQFQGLTREQMASGAGAQVRFQIKRDAGSLDCEGWFRGGKGSGHFTFNPNPAFAAELRRQGVVGEPTDKDLFSLAVSDIGFAFMAELKSQGYERPTMEQLVRSAHHGVRLDYLRGLKSLGYQLGSVDALIRMRDHGVTIAFIESLRDNGYTRLTADELVRTRDHGVTASYISEMKAAGYTLPPLEELVRLRDHGVTPTFARELRDEGYGQLPLDQLVRLRDHGVSVSFVRELKQLGYTGVAAEQLIRLRDHGVTSSFIRRVKDTRGDKPTLDELIRMRDRGDWK